MELASAHFFRDQDKPILLSIGYSSCHWCHVMAHVALEDQATADLINPDYNRHQGLPRRAAAGR